MAKILVAILVVVLSILAFAPTAMASRADGVNIEGDGSTEPAMESYVVDRFDYSLPSGDYFTTTDDNVRTYGCVWISNNTLACVDQESHAEFACIYSSSGNYITCFGHDDLNTPGAAGQQPQADDLARAHGNRGQITRPPDGSREPC